MERLLSAAKELSEKVDSNEAAAGELLRQCETLQEELKSMKQYRECLETISGSDESRTRLPNIEFSYIRQLQQDNSELRILLEEHQSALDMIMSKYREQMVRFMKTSSDDLNADSGLSEELQYRTDQLCSMAAVMYKAAGVEDSTVNAQSEKIAQLEYENKHLRELLQFSPHLTSEGEASVFLSSSREEKTPPPTSAAGENSEPIIR